MKIIRGFGKVVKPFVNFPAWMGWQQISTTGKSIKDAAKLITKPAQAKRKETFDEALQRLRLTENDLQQRAKLFRRMMMVYSGIALILFFYTIYLLAGAHLAAGLLSFVLTLLALSLAFRQHFWYFQVQQRKLGCTIKEWFNATFRGAK